MAFALCGEPIATRDLWDQSQILGTRHKFAQDLQCIQWTLNVRKHLIGNFRINFGCLDMIVSQ